jgi:hypothetical protein
VGLEARGLKPAARGAASVRGLDEVAANVKFRLRTVSCTGVVAADAGDTTRSTASVTVRLAARCDAMRWHDGLPE